MVYCSLLHKITEPLHRAAAGGGGPGGPSFTTYTEQPPTMETSGPSGQLLQDFSIILGKKKEFLAVKSLSFSSSH